MSIRKPKQSKEDIWEDFFNHPLLASVIEEASAVDSDDDPELEGEDEMAPEAAPAAPKQSGGGGEEGMDLEQLSADFQNGDISQEDLVKMYQTGKISKEEIQQIISNVESGEEPQSEEELLAQQIDQTNDMFIKFALYDKIAELTEKLGYFKENFEDTRSSMYERVIQLSEFLNILSNLIFSIETPVSYQMYGSILLQLTELFDEYNQEQQKEEHQEDVVKAKEKQIDKEEQQADIARQDLDGPNENDLIDHESGMDSNKQHDTYSRY